MNLILLLFFYRSLNCKHWQSHYFLDRIKQTQFTCATYDTGEVVAGSKHPDCVGDDECTNKEETAEEKDVRNAVSDAEDAASGAGQRPVRCSAICLVDTVSVHDDAMLVRHTVLV